MQLLAGPGVAQPGAQGAAKLLRQIVAGIGGAPPPQQGGDDDDVGGDVHRVGGGGPGGGQDGAARRRADGAGDVDAQAVQRDGALQLAAWNQLRHDGLPDRRHQRRPDPAEEGQPGDGGDAGDAQPRLDHQRGADAGEQALDDDQHPPPVHDVRQHPRRNRQQEDGQRARRLDQRDGGGRSRQIEHQPRARHVAHEGADVAQHGRHPQHGEQPVAQRREGAGGLFPGVRDGLGGHARPPRRWLSTAAAAKPPTMARCSRKVAVWRARSGPS